SVALENSNVSTLWVKLISASPIFMVRVSMSGNPSLPVPVVLKRIWSRQPLFRPVGICGGAGGCVMGQENSGRSTYQPSVSIFIFCFVQASGEDSIDMDD